MTATNMCSKFVGFRCSPLYEKSCRYVDLQVSAIMAAILNFSNPSMVTEWHLVDYQFGPFKDSKSTETIMRHKIPAPSKKRCLATDYSMSKTTI